MIRDLVGPEAAMNWRQGALRAGPAGHGVCGGRQGHGAQGRGGRVHGERVVDLQAARSAAGDGVKQRHGRSLVTCQGSLMRIVTSFGLRWRAAKPDSTIGELRIWVRQTHRVSVNHAVKWEKLKELQLTLKKHMGRPDYKGIIGWRVGPRQPIRSQGLSLSAGFTQTHPLIALSS